MGVVEDLVKAREAFDRRDWVQAFDAMTAAGATAAHDLDQLAASAQLLGRKADSVRAYQQAYQAHLEAGDVRAAIRTTVFLAHLLLTTGESAVAAGWVARGRRILSSLPDDVVEHGYLRIPEMFGHIERAEWSEAAEAAADVTNGGRHFGDSLLLAMGLASQGRLATRSGQVKKGLALLDEAMVELSGGDIPPVMAGDIYCSMIEACQDLSDFGRAAQWTATLTAWCDDQPGLVPFTGQCAVHRGQIMRIRGAFPEALVELRGAVDRYLNSPNVQPAGKAYAECGDILRLQGEFDAADRSYQDAKALGHDPQPGLALLWLARGRESAALGAVRRILSEPRDDVARSQVLPDAIEVLVATHQTDEAGHLVNELSSIASDVGCDALQAMAGRASGVHLLSLGQHADALVHVRRAGELWGRLSAPFEVARCQLAAGRCLAALGDIDSAHQEWELARDAFARLGAVVLEAEAAQLVKPEAPGGMSPREIEVLRLVATGRTNPEIAAMLVLSEKTVARHLSNIFAKLDVSSRTAAAAFAYERHLI